MYKTSIATLEDFRKLRPVWNELLLKMEYPIVFLTWEWMYTWWEHFGGNREPVILVVSEDDTIRGILPLYSERMILESYWLSGRVLTHCSATDLFPDHTDLIAPPDEARECFASILQFLRSQYRAWDVLRIPMVASSSQLLNWLGSKTTGLSHLDFDVEEVSVAHFIPMSGTFDDYFGGLDAKQRYNVRSRAKKLYEQHGARYVACDGSAMECLRRVFALHRQRAARKGIASTFSDSRVHAFHESLADRIGDKGWLSLRFLMRDKEILAASYNFEFAGRLFSYQKGFDPTWERYGPGSVLMYELIREAFANKRVEYNFLQGDEAYKGTWTKDYRTLSNVNVYNNSLLGHLARGGYRLKQRIKERLGKRNEEGPPSRHLPTPVVTAPGVRALDKNRRAKYVVQAVGIEALRTCREEWNALVTSMHYPTVFSSWEWIYTWWEHFGANRHLRLLLLRQNGQLRGVLPLFSEMKSMGADGRAGRILAYCSASDLFPDPLDLICAAADSRECAAAALEYLATADRDWDVLHLRFLTEESGLLQYASSASSGRFVVDRISGAPYVALTGSSYDEYFRGLSGNERSKISRCRRRLLEKQGAEYIDMSSENTEGVLKSLVSLHEKRAQEKGIHSSFARPHVLAFHRHLLSRLDKSQVWFRGLRLGQEAIAVFYGYAFAGRISYFQLGHDPAWGKFSPGVVLLQETIREAFERGFTEYNFLQGEEKFKGRWTHNVRQLYTVDAFSNSKFGRLSSWAVRARQVIKSGISSLVGR